MHTGRWCDKSKFEREVMEQKYTVEGVMCARPPPEHRRFVVHWEGYEPVFYDDYSEATLEPLEHIEHCQCEIDEYFVSASEDMSDDIQGLVYVVSTETSEAAHKHLCVYCGKLYASTSTLQSHQTRKDAKMCKEKPRSRKNTRADKHIQREKLQQRQEELDHVMLRGQALKNVFTFRYLGYHFRADGDRRHAMAVRMGIASTRFSECKKVWKSKVISQRDKMRLFDGGVVSMLVYGCEIWMLDESTQASLRGWCARRMAKITGKSIREECIDPTYPLIAKARAKRLRWLGHILRSHEDYLVRRVLVAQCEQCIEAGEPYPVGSIMMDAPAHSTMQELIDTAENRKGWRSLVNNIIYDGDSGSDSDDTMGQTPFKRKRSSK